MKKSDTGNKKTGRENSGPVPQSETAPAWIYVVLFCAAFAVYTQVGHFDFLNYDDPFYVSHNAHVRDGVTPEGFKWAITSGEGANWFPLTRISHLLDAQFFGMDSGWHHLTNVFIHGLSTLLLFAFLYRAFPRGPGFSLRTGTPPGKVATGALWPSAFVALVFALHPLHVESVAWISERKDVLSAFFWMLSLWAYVRYTEKPGGTRYLLALSAFCLGLMSKPMIVSLPFLLVLLDAWPLARKKALPEKIPFFALSVVVAIATYLVQQAGRAVSTLSAHPLGLRIENALDSYIVYIAKMFWPSGLAVFYPFPVAIPAWQPMLAAILLLAVSAFVVRVFRDCPYLAIGWFWYLVTMAPVIGIVQVGGQARADRYMYVPMIGLTIMLAWGAAHLLRWRPRLKPAMQAAAALACLACVVLTWRQAGYWSNSESLFQHAVDVTTGNDVAQHNLGTALLEIPGRLPDAIAHLQAAVEINSRSAGARTDLGNALSKLPGRLSDAITEYRAAVRIDPSLAVPHNNLGMALSKISGETQEAALQEAIVECQAAVRIDPDFAEAHNNLGVALARAGRTADAEAQFREALRLDPGYTQARANLTQANSESDYDLALTLAKTGRLAEAIVHFEAALRLNPKHAEAHNNLGFVLTSFPARMPEAIGHFEAALRINPENAEAHYNLGVALSNIPGRMPEAIKQLEAAERLKPDAELEQLLKRLRGK